MTTIKELKQQAQELLWKTARAGREEANPELANLYREMALIHEQLARRRLAANDPGGWIDALAAVTALRNSGDLEAAEELLASYRKTAQEQTAGSDVLDELQRLQEFLSSM